MEAPLPSQLLTAEHRQIDIGIKAVADGGGQVAALAEALALLRRHLYVEEAILFPPLVKTGLTMPVFVMRREHGEMWPALTRLANGCAAGTALDGLRQGALWLFRLLQVHNGKEEDIVYAAADRMVGTGAGAGLVAALQAAQMPAGWVCALAPK